MDLKIKIAPSLLAADFARLGEEIKKVEDAGCDQLHLDIMDGRFVPNITIGPVVVKAIRRSTKLPLCAHLMIEEPWRYAKAFADAGADTIVVHIETCGERLGRTLDQIRALGKHPGISLNPATPASSIFACLDKADEVLVMTVNPGFGGQAFMPEALSKVTEIRSRFKKDIAVDGGINPETAKYARAAGANVLVAGTAIFSQPNVRKAMEQIRNGDTHTH